MPCRDDYSISCKCEPYKSRCDNYARMLCFLLGELKYDGLLKEYIDDNISEWWEKHQRVDTGRVSGRITKLYKKQKKREPEKVAEIIFNSAYEVHSVSRYHQELFLELAKKIDKKMTAIEQEEKKKKTKCNKAIAKLSDEEKMLIGIKL